MSTHVFFCQSCHCHVAGTIEAVASLAVGGTWEGHQELKFSKKQMHTMMQTLLQSRSRAARMKLPGMQVP
jgi:hypothetical protein